MDRLTAAKVAVDLANTASFTESAKRLAMSRAMVTRYIDGLESWLNVRLFHRTTRKVALTSAGEQSLPQLQSWIEQAHQLQYQLTQDELLAGKIRLAVSMSFGFSQLVPAIAAFTQKHPKVEIDVNVQDQAVDLTSERIDLAIRITAEPDPSLIGRSIAQCDSVLVASPSYLAKAPAITEPADLSHQQCLGYKNFEQHVWHFTYQQQHRSVAVNCAFSANEATVLLSAALQGMGVALQPTYLVNEILQRGELVQLLPQWQPKTMNVYALYSSRKYQPPAVRALIDHLVAFFSSGQWQYFRL
ncbi:LysR family transcriptional regulator [Agarivorans sp.]|uniref:LysR family transcriptional regulator n=1 Tax=Agarivorans sp. TaxID=1872412 RepID=UPI003D036299